jgi:hypothetical protein
MKTNRTPVTFKVVTLSSIPKSKQGCKPNTSRYHGAIMAATKYTKRAILLTIPEIKTRKQAQAARYSVLSALKSRKLEKTVTLIQRGAKLYLCHNEPTKTPVTA